MAIIHLLLAGCAGQGRVQVLPLSVTLFRLSLRPLGPKPGWFLPSPMRHPSSMSPSPHRLLGARFFPCQHQALLQHNSQSGLEVVQPPQQALLGWDPSEGILSQDGRFPRALPPPPQDPGLALLPAWPQFP